MEVLALVLHVHMNCQFVVKLFNWYGEIVQLHYSCICAKLYQIADSVVKKNYYLLLYKLFNFTA